MTMQAVTLNVPNTIYKKIEQAAILAQRPLEQVLTEAVTAVAPVINTASNQLQTALAQMAYLNDATLWQMARATMPKEQQTELEDLHHQKQNQGLSKNEEKTEQTLLQLYRETILIRAQAAVLLKLRGYDISNLEQFKPLE